MPQVGSPVVNQVANGSSLVLTKTGVGAGNSLYIQFTYGLGAGAAPTFSDSSTQTWTKDKSTGVTGSFNTGADIWRLDGANSGTHTVTITMASGSFAIATLTEFSGMAGGAPDVVAQNFSTSNVTSGNSGTTGNTAQASSMAMAAICVNPPGGTSNDGLTTPGGWTNQQLYTNTSVVLGASHITKDLSSTGTQQAAWTWSESSNYAAVIAVYKYASTGTTVSCTVGAATCAGPSATVQLATAVNGTVGTAADAGLSAAVVLTTNVAGTVGAAVDVGPSAAVVLATNVACTVGTAADDGLFALVQPGTSINAAIGAVANAGLSAAVVLTTNVAGTVGTAVDAGQAANVQLVTAVNGTVGDASASGLAATVQLVTVVACSVGASIAAGLTAAVIGATTILCAVGTAVNAGQTATVQLATAVNCSTGTVSDAGQTATVQLVTAVNAAPGTASDTGQQCAVQFGTGLSIVSVTQIKQFWQSGTDWSAKNVSATQAGDAILAFGAFYAAGTLGQKYPPTDNNGTFVQGVDTGRPDPGSYPGYPQPVTSNIYYQFNAAVGVHSITPPNIGPNVNDDGNVFVAVVRGLTTSAVVRATGHSHQVSNSAGTTFANASVSLSTPCQIGDDLFAVLVYDDDRVFGTVTLDEPTLRGWSFIGHDTDAATSCPCGVYWKIATAADTQTVTLGWNDPHATVTDASIIAFAPLQVTTVDCTPGAATDAGRTANIQTVTAVNATVGTASDAGQSANIQPVTAVNTTVGVASDTGQPATVQIGTTINATVGAVLDAGQGATIATATNVPGNIGMMAGVGLPATIQLSTAINGTTGVANYVGLPAAVVIALNVSCATGAANYVGLPAAVVIALNVSCTTGAANYAGLPAGIGGSGASLVAGAAHTYRGQARTRIYTGLIE